jgi:hypothetical protein
MNEANLSESQLQQAVNTAYARRVFELHGFWPLPFVPSLVAEAELGWDTAFYFPWILHPPSGDDQGSNVFLQYKLSAEFVSPGAKEWPEWGTAYYRFKIPHNTDDYHQWDRLKALANKQCPTYYATNATLLLAELTQNYQAGTLPENTPLLDVRLTSDQHKHVTFTPSSAYFLLHSEKEEVHKTTVEAVLSGEQQGAKMGFADAADRIVSDLSEVGGEDGLWRDELARLRQETRRRRSLFAHPSSGHSLRHSFVGISELRWHGSR